jgi:hypothetical protein
MKPSCCLSDLVREIKKASNEFINTKWPSQNKFYWQGGFGAFSYSSSSLDKVVRYIQNQKQHHRKKMFKDEYREFLVKYKIDYDDKYLFNWLDD